MKKTFSYLKKFNIFVGFILLIQGVIMLWKSTNFSLPITSSYLKFDPVTQTLNPVLNQITKIQIGPLVASFLLLSALALLAITLPGIFDWYVKNLKKGANYARWIEYSITSSLMIVVISMLVGIYDIASLILIFCINTTMILFGWMMELYNQTTKKTNWTPFIFGSFAGLIPWIVITIYLIGAGSGVPNFVYWIYGSLFVFFNIFAINMVLQYKKIGPWKDYIYGEKVYIVLSLVAKSLLAWQVFFGTLRPM
jgi:hypothetical protein